MFLLILRNLRHRRLRAWLTILGVVIGTTLILSLNLLGDGMRRAVARQMQSFGSDLIFVFPGKEDNPFIGMLAGAKLRDRDIRAVRGIEGVRLVTPMQTGTVRIGYRGEEKFVIIHGSPWEETRAIFEESRGYGLAEGEWPARDDLPQVILGSDLAAERFSSPIGAGDTVTVRGRDYEVAGVFKPTGDPTDDSMAYFSFERLLRITGEASGANSMILKTEAGRDPAEIEAAIKARLAGERGATDFVVLTPDKAYRIVGDILGVIQLVLGGIAAVALVVGGVGIMNAMFTSVLERTREIGLLKALGATDRRVLTLFLVEAGAIGAVGGGVGVGVSSAIAYAAEYAAKRQGFMFLDIAVEPSLVLGVLSFTFVLGVFFGAVPAWQAARLKPTEALRYE